MMPKPVLASGLITISGRVTQPIAAEVRIIFAPMSAEELLQFEVVDATLGDNTPRPAAQPGRIAAQPDAG
jgi:hypothetical protein